MILSAKAAFSEQLDLVLKAATEGTDPADMVRAIHDAAVHLGAQCQSMDGIDGEADGANKAAALSLRLKALSR